MTPPSKLSQRSSQADAVDQFPFHGVATAALGALGVAMIFPLVLAVSPDEFVDDISLQSFVIGLVLAITIDYVLGYLTDDSSHWPTLPTWMHSDYSFIIVFASGIVAFSMSLLPAPSWAPAVAIGGMHAFATAGVTTLILGGTRSAVWVVRQVA